MGPHAVAVLVECLTDNRNRTVQDLRATLVRNQGQMGESGSVMWSFDRIGSLIAKPKKQGLDPEEAAINCEANEVEAIGDGSFQFISNPTDLAKVETALEDSKDWEVLKAELSYRAKNPVDLSEAQEADLRKFIDAIEDSDDVKRVHLAI
jgi:transcriptional/translational regulatory protein YebC/TACO1